MGFVFEGTSSEAVREKAFGPVEGQECGFGATVCPLCFPAVGEMWEQLRGTSTMELSVEE